VDENYYSLRNYIDKSSKICNLGEIRTRYYESYNIPWVYYDARFKIGNKSYEWTFYVL